MRALHREVVPPSGVEYCASLNLIGTTVFRKHGDGDERPKAVHNLVVARSNLLRIYEIQEDTAQVQSQPGREKDKWTRVRRDTEAVEGEVEMDTQGEGFVNMGTVKSTSTISPVPSKTFRFVLVRERRVHGIVTGLTSLKINATAEDSLDRLLVSFKDAKLALLEWSPSVHDLITVSIHTYERAPQMISPRMAFQAALRVDSGSRCAALSLPRDALAILPFYQIQADLDAMDVDHAMGREIPYSPSFVLDLAASVDSRIRNVIDFAFLPSFNNPTIAVLFQTQQTWTGRLKEYKDTCHLVIFTLDLITRKYPTITMVDDLPHDCASILCCTPSLGGVVIISDNAIIYVDQASRKTALPVNGWTSRISDMPMQTQSAEDPVHDLQLEGARGVFIDDHTFFVILSDGTIYPVEIVMDGRIVSRLSMSAAIAQTTIPSTTLNISPITEGKYSVLFVGSTVGPSVLLKVSRIEQLVSTDLRHEAPLAAIIHSSTIEMDDDDDDIYGDATRDLKAAPNLASNGHAIETRSVLHLSLCDSLPAYGPINDLSFSLTRNGERPVAELVAATGYGRLGGFTLFQRDLPTRTKRKLHAVGGARGVWSLPIRQTLKVNGPSTDRIHIDSVIVSTDASPTPGLTRFASRTSRHDITITSRRTETTISAGAFFQRTAILHVTTDLIRVLEPDGSERQCIKDMDGTVKRPKIRYCHISDPFVLILREDDSLGLFVGDAERGRIRRKDMTPMGEKISRYSAGCFYSDHSGILESHSNPRTSGPDTLTTGKQKNTTSSLEAAVDSQRGTQWLVLCRPQGIVEIWTLPKLTIVFSTSVVRDLPAVISDSFDPPALSLPEDPPRKPQELDIDQILLAQLGDTCPQPHLLVLLRCGQMAIYQATAIEGLNWPQDSQRSSALPVQFVKVSSRTFEPRQNEPNEKSLIVEQRRILRHLIPFQTSPTPNTTLSGVFFTGDQPCWIIATAKAGVKVHRCGYSVVNSFTTCSLWDSKRDFLMYTDEGPCLLEWMPEINIDTEVPSQTVPHSRTYTNMTFDQPTGLMVAASSLLGPFILFDEDGNKVWEPEGSGVTYPMAEMSTIELFPPDFSLSLDGHEFLPGEFVNALESISLETQSTESGIKDFIVVGTTINRGEDLAVKGATYVFDVVEVVADHERVSRSFKLRLLCRDEAKGPVTAICGINGYLVSSMGQKIFVRAFDLDERLVGVAFLDVGVYVTSLRTVKNLLLIGDVVKSAWFVAFQEDPFKLVILAKDVQAHSVVSADFLFSSDGQFYIATMDGEGIIRLLEYDPSDPESRSGQYLLCRTEFHGQVESRASTVVALRLKGDDGLVPCSRLIYGAADGAIHSITPIDDHVTKRLLLLQGQLSRNIQHIAGLNPRVFRIVKNDTVSKPLSRGILDGNLLAAFEEMSIPGQNEITTPIGTERLTVLRDWSALGGPW